MQKFIISPKDKQTGRDVMAPYIVNSLDGLGNYSERVSPLVLIVTGKQIGRASCRERVLRLV